MDLGLVSKSIPYKAAILSALSQTQVQLLHYIQCCLRIYMETQTSETVTETCIKCEWEHLSNTLRDSVQLLFIQRENDKLTQFSELLFFFLSFLEMCIIPFWNSKSIFHLVSLVCLPF